MKREEREVLAAALDRYGFPAQRLMFAEEVGEALSALSKVQRNRCDICAVVEELADVVIMAEQMALYFGWTEYEIQRCKKIARLRERLK